MVTPDNASLALTKFERWPPPAAFKSENNKEVFKSVTRLGPTDAYKSAYKRWNAEIHALPGTTLAATFTVDGKMVVGIGAENILESSVTMNRVWGMPLIPGSSLKGLASHFARSVLAAPKGPIDDKQFIDLFGTTEDAGYLTWLDAWYVPEPMTRAPFTLDVVTPHHGSYYQDDPHDVQNPPWDFEDPKPSYFISVRGTFLVAVQVVGPDSTWEQGFAYAAMNILERALLEWGIGAKTNAGYGRMTFGDYQQEWARTRRLDDMTAVQQAREETEAAKVAALEVLKQAEALTVDEQRGTDLLQRIDSEAGDLLDVAPGWYGAWEKLEDHTRKIEIGRRIIERWKEDQGVYNRLTLGKPPAKNPQHQPKKYAVKLVAWLDEHAPDESSS